ncbi:MAG TPA: endo-1,4-beta-xylanase [Stellaceae bacterium]|nr:endo-1,4-beta-xylanase [Stellaceae bacterium]
MMHRVGRRGFIAGGLAAGAQAAGLSPLDAASRAQQALAEIARDRGIRYGSTAMASQLLAGDDFTDLLIREAAVLVPENEMKWSHMSTTAFGADYRVADFIVDFAATHGLHCRGHNLLWFFRTPKWFTELEDREMARAAMLQRITDMVGRYRGRIDSWDVVNEPVNPSDGRADHLRSGTFLEQIGPEYLDLAYGAARAADPKARLVLNEYDVEYDTPEMDRKRAAVLKVAEGMRKRGVPLDALGVQAHLAVSRHPFSEKKLRDYLAAAAGLGLEIQITELDCNDDLAPAEIALRDRLVADEYRRFLDVALDEPAVNMVMTWGLSDRFSWIVRHETNPVAMRRDGVAERPLPFDRDLKRKPAWQAIADAFARAPARHNTPG